MLIEEVFFSAIRGIGMLVMYLFVEFIPEISIWIWQRVKKAKEPPLDFSTIHNQRKARRLERRAEHREERHDRVGNRGAPID